MSLNIITIMGRITKDIELRRTNNGTSVASFTLAVDRDFDKGKTDFIECVAWKNTAEFAAKYFGKGSKVVLTGSLQMRDWEDKNGSKRRNAEIIVSSMYFADSKKVESSGFAEIEDDEDFPF
jgi:single-strand DNA-binding protein